MLAWQRHLIIFSTCMVLVLTANTQAWAGRNGNRWDKTPDAFQFIDQTGVALSTQVNANTITVSGINTSIPVSISGGEYSINGGAYTSASGSVNNGASINVRQVSSSQYSTVTHAVLNLNGLTDSFDVTTLANSSDSIPNAFNFVDQSGVPINTTVISGAITVSGINTTTAISVSGGQYSINGGAYSSTNGSVNNGDSVTVKVTSSASYSTSVNSTLTIGGVSDVFSVTTQADPTDSTPDPFSFTDQTDVALNTVITSDNIFVSGINTTTDIFVTGGEYSVNGGAYTSANGLVSNGDSVNVRQTSADTQLVTTDATLTIGGVSDTFSVTTLSDTPLTFQLPAQSPGNAGFTSEHFAGSDNCTMCHNNLSDDQNQDMSIETDWSATMMANSTRDPFWKAKVRTELNRNPHLADVINDKCSRCHAPMANYEAKVNNETKGILDNGFLNQNHPRHDEAMNGVSCTLCHQVEDDPTLGTLDGFTGKYNINPNKEIYGPYDNLFPNPMIMNTGYTPMYSLHTKESEMCATCHNLKTPYVDEQGNVLSTTPESEFPEQMPYGEWLNSDYAGTQSCQSCHMSRSNGVAISNRPMWLGARDNFAVHEFVGANKLMLNMLKDNKQQLGVTSNNFNDVIAATDVILQSAANIELVSQSLNQGQLDFTLKVNSQTGHKLPSAYPSRRVIVHVTVTDDQNNVVFESGKVNADGSIQGVDADSDAMAFEPHYELITSADQVQVYEAIMGDNNDQVTYTLLRGMIYLKDNRLLPNGFNKATAPSDVAVNGAALNDSNFIGGSDQISYQITGLAAGAYTVRAELVYQTLAYGFARDLFNDSSAEVNDFKKMYNESTNKASVITALEFAAQ